MTYQKKVEIGDATLLLGDSRDILPTLPKLDACVTDPPYGIADKWKGGAGGKSSWRIKATETHDWDSVAPDFIAEIVEGVPSIVFGGNYFALPPARGWLVWDKKQRGTWTTGHCELAWTSLDMPIRAFSLSQVEAHTGMGKQHPSQKPIEVMAWAMSFLPLGAVIVLDPFMGSGTTGVACVQLGRKFIGIEKEERYFQIACERIERAYAQGQLFEPAPMKQEQGKLEC